MTRAEIIALLLGVAAVSWAAPLIRLAHAPAEVIAALRLAFAALPVLVAALLWRRPELRAFRRDELALAAAAGLALACHFLAWIAAVQRTSIVASAVLVTTQPVFVGAFGWLLLSERPSRAQLVGVALATVGAAFLAGGDLDDPGSLEGDALALAGAVFAAAYFLAGRRLRHAHSNLAYVGVVYPVAAITALTAVGVSGQSLGGSPPEAYGFIVLLALGPQLIGHTSLNWALGSMSAVAVAIAVLGEPVGATLIAATLLDEPPTLVQLTGGVAVLAGIGIALVGRRSADVQGRRDSGD